MQHCPHSTTAPVSANPGGAENEGSSSANLKTVLAPLFDPRAGTLAPIPHDRNGENDCGDRVVRIARRERRATAFQPDTEWATSERKLPCRCRRGSFDAIGARCQGVAG